MQASERHQLFGLLFAIHEAGGRMEEFEDLSTFDEVTFVPVGGDGLVDIGIRLDRVMVSAWCISDLLRIVQVVDENKTGHDKHKDQIMLGPLGERLVSGAVAILREAECATPKGQ